MGKRALILFAHGARNPRWATPFVRVQERVGQHAPDVKVVLAFLEHLSPDLPQVTAQLTQEGVTDVVIAPLFLGQGGHVVRDLPCVVEKLRQAYPQMCFRIADVMGEDEDVLAAMAAWCVRLL